MATALRTESLRRPRAVWWALCLALFFVTAPTLSRALAFASSGAISSNEICTAQGPRTAAPDGASLADSSTGQESAPTLDHCPFCLLQTGHFAPPPHHLAYLFMVFGGQQEIAARQAFFYVDTTVLWAPPRGPPGEQCAG